MQTRAILLDDRLPDGRDSVMIDWDDSWIELSHQQRIRLDLESANLSLGGNRNAFLMIRHPLLEPASAYTEMTPDLTRYLAGHPLLKTRLSNELRSFNKQKKYGLAALMFVFALLGGLFVFRSQVAAGLVTLIPFSTEKKVADLLYSRRESTDPEKKITDKQLAELLSPLLAAHPDWKSKLTFHINSDKDANAYATIGGHIFINRGLVELLETPEQLLAVIAHETAHANGRHVARSVFQGVGLFLVVQTLLGDVTGLVAVLADQGAPLLMMKHSRELETEADRTAVKDLAESKINPRGLVESLKKLEARAQKELEGKTPDQISKILSKVDLWSTHPEMDQRIKTLEAAIVPFEHAQFAPIEFDYRAFQTSVRKNY